MDHNTALRIISSYQKNAPVDIAGIATEMGLAIFQDALTDGISGVLLKDANYKEKTQSGFVILVNKNEPIVRQRFTVAHEMGHFVLHRDLIGEKFEENYMLRSNRTSNEQEVAANQFAADLLMPFSLINTLVEQGHKTVDALAEKLQVSKIAMGIRLGLPT